MVPGANNNRNIILVNNRSRQNPVSCEPRKKVRVTLSVRHEMKYHTCTQVATFRGHMLRTLLKAAVVAELGAVAGGYYVFHKLNTDAQFRGWAGDACPSCLDGFCSAVVGLGYPLPPDLVAFRQKISSDAASSSSPSSPSPSPSSSSSSSTPGDVTSRHSARAALKGVDGGGASR